MYKDDWESIVGNCDTMLFLGGKDLTTAEYISKTLGKQTITTKDRSLSVSAKSGNSSQSYKQSARELMMPDELVGMSNSHCVVIVRGVDPFYDKKYDYKNHPQYDQTADADEEKRYINSLDNMAVSYEEAKAKADTFSAEDERIRKYTSLDELVKDNPEWTKYPSIYDEFKIIASFDYDEEDEDERTDDATTSSSAPFGQGTPPVPSSQTEGQGTTGGTQPSQSTDEEDKTETETRDIPDSGQEDKGCGGIPNVEQLIFEGDYFADE